MILRLSFLLLNFYNIFQIGIENTFFTTKIFTVVTDYFLKKLTFSQFLQTFFSNFTDKQTLRRTFGLFFTNKIVGRLIKHSTLGRKDRYFR